MPPLLIAALNGHRTMVQWLNAHGAKVSNALRWLDDAAQEQHDRLILDYPLSLNHCPSSFQELESSPIAPWLSLDPVEVLDNAIMIAAQLGIVDAGIDSIAWEWKIPSAIQSQPCDLSLEKVVTVMKNPLRHPLQSDNFLAITWGEWLADYITLPEHRDALTELLSWIVTQASEVKDGSTGRFTFLDAHLPITDRVSRIQTVRSRHPSEIVPLGIPSGLEEASGFGEDSSQSVQLANHISSANASRRLDGG